MAASQRHTVVTGGASGIGAAVVADLLERGHRVTIFDLQQPAEVPEVRAQIVDLRDEAAVEAAMAAAWQWQPVTGVVASHGIRGAYLPALEMPLDRLRLLFDVHVVGALAVSRAMVRRLDGSPASIVLVTSTTAYGGWANQADYGTAKAAERQLMANLAIEWAPLGVRVNAVAPGHTRTPMVEHLIENGYDIGAVETLTPDRRIAEPAEQAAAITWLLEDAHHVVGQCLAVDGGWTVRGK